MAEDLTQESFLKAILSLPDRREDLRAWLFTVARHLLMDQLRRRRDEPLPEDDSLPSPEEDGPLAAYLRQERNRRLLSRMAELEPRRREVLSLQYFSGLSQKQIASLLNMSHENVRVLSLRARRELKQKLEEDGYDIS